MSIQLQISQSPLRLDGYFFTRVAFSINESVSEDYLQSLFLSIGYQPQLLSPLDQPPPLFDVSWEAGTDTNDAARFRFKLNIKSDSKTSPQQFYDFDVEMVAFFSWTDTNVAPTEANRQINIAALALMYSTIRETLASATGRSPIPALNLPSVMFNIVEPVDNSGKKTNRKHNRSKRSP
jgi:preprotein translocase subunit SecB